MKKHENKRIQKLLDEADQDLQSTFLLFCKIVSKNTAIMPYEVRRLEYDLKRKVRNIITDLSNEIQDEIKIELEAPRIQYNQA
jgi:hypothetical protein